MINIQMQGQDVVIASLNNITNPSVIRAAIYAMAESYTEDTLDYIQQGRAFTNRTGHLGQSIGWRPTGNESAEVYANAGYAAYVEFGTRPHVIRPKSGRKALKIPVAGGGGYILRRAVNHPGSKPYPFFYVDQSQRRANMQAAAISVIGGAI